MSTYVDKDDRAVPESHVPSNKDRRVLCVDLDGTLLFTDTFLECIIKCIRNNPFSILRLVLLLCRGRAQSKRILAEEFAPEIEFLPHCEPLLEHLRNQKQGGRKLVLATAADRHVAHAVVRRFNLFEDDVIASDGHTNCTGAEKLASMIRRFGAEQFEYFGNSVRDIPIWGALGGASAVNPSPLVRLLLRIRGIPLNNVITAERQSFRVILKTLRINQWVKNLLVFVPLILNHNFTNPHLFWPTLITAVAFSLVASGIYIVNDLYDLEADRKHPRKKKRPLAAGRITIGSAVILAATCLGLGSTLASSVSPYILTLLAGYLVLAITYSAHLKLIALLDVFVLTMFYALRIIAGALAAGIEPSPWLIQFSLFAFFSLAVSKRYSELLRVQRENGTVAERRSYTTADCEQLALFGTAASFVSVLVVGLYINGPELKLLYRHPNALWLACPILLYWFSRLWMLARRGELDEDPITFALRDRVSQVAGVLAIATFLIAL